MAGEPLRIHLLNAGWGDSVVIHLPDNKFGVVDCNCRSSDANQNETIKFLESNGATSLEFVCLTHPHADHFSGLWQLFERFTVSRFWYFHIGRNGSLRRVFRYIDYEAERLTKSLLTPMAQHGAKQFERLLEQVEMAEASDRGFMAEPVRDSTDLYPPNIEVDGGVPKDAVHIRAIAPNSVDVQNYYNALNKCFAADGSFVRSDLPPVSHNDLSIVLWVTYGSSSVILCADLEKHGWKVLLERYASDKKPNGLAAQAVKVSHHGSVTGTCPGLWPALAGHGSCCAVLSPSAAHALPDEEVLKEIADNAADLWICSAKSVAETMDRATLQAEFGGLVGLQIYETIKDFARLQPLPFGICTLEVHSDARVICTGHGAAFKWPK